MKTYHDTRLQLNWANKRMNALDRSIHRFLEKHLNPVCVNEYFDCLEEDFFFIGAPSLPESWPLRLGEIVNALRSALDYLVWELSVSLNANIPPSKKRNIMFPIMAHPNQPVFLRATEFLPEAARDFVEACQPYNCGAWPESVVLQFLDTMVRLHKHRTLNLVARRVFYTDDSIPNALRIAPNYLDKHAVMAIPKGTEEQFKPKVGMDIGTEIAVPQGLVIGIGWDIVVDIHQFIRNEIVPPFSGFLQQAQRMTEPLTVL